MVTCVMNPMPIRRAMNVPYTYSSQSTDCDCYYDEGNDEGPCFGDEPYQVPDGPYSENSICKSNKQFNLIFPEAYAHMPQDTT